MYHYVFHVNSDKIVKGGKNVTLEVCSDRTTVIFVDT